MGPVTGCQNTQVSDCTSSTVHHEKPNNAVIHQCTFAYESIILLVWLRVIYFWHSEYKSNYTVYYIDFRLLLGLIRYFKMELAFSKFCQISKVLFKVGTIKTIKYMLSMIFSIVTIFYTMTPHTEINVFITRWKTGFPFTWKSRYFTGIYVVNCNGILPTSVKWDKTILSLMRNFSPL